MAGGKRAGALGRLAEDRALGMLLTAGLVPITRNFRCAGGEIDLVMSDGATLVFVEVRSRRDARGGTATASITRSKQQRLLRAAAVYLCRYPHWNECDIRFDLVTFDGMPPALRWHHAVITEDSDGYADE